MSGLTKCDTGRSLNLSHCWAAITTSISKNFYFPKQYPCVCVCVCVCARVYTLVPQLCLTLCDPMDYSSPGFSVMGFSRQEYWSGLLFPSPRDLPDPGIEPAFLVTPKSAGGFLTIVSPRKPPDSNPIPMKTIILSLPSPNSHLLLCLYEVDYSLYLL